MAENNTKIIPKLYFIPICAFLPIFASAQMIGMQWTALSDSMAVKTIFRLSASGGWILSAIPIEISAILTNRK
ncbi:unnamed protein product [Blepharisma stoltei]|uniref:Uncharacterized protein n=1 Tax=Blepharisma stoltei TaxID=1481888 RepID=A0AAU9IV20_9CILI|nr:unnamed protein product [Blepharisma stoltei]